MRKIDLSNYLVGDVPFEVRPSLVAVLLNQKGIDGRELIRRDALATRIESTQEETLLLEEDDYARVMGGLAATDLSQHGRAVVEFVRRVLDAPVTEVVEK